jgi:hypothetical protein
LREARGGQALALARKARLQPVRERQVHVVAAQHQVLAHGDARERGQSTRCGFHADQRQVGRAAAHVGHQHQAAAFQLRGQLPALQRQPVVERGLGFFEQMHFG